MTAPADRIEAAPPLRLLPASRFAIEQLTAAYNQTRVDYLVPMPMSVARLAEYIHIYDVDLDCSCVALAEGQIVGLGMLGVRPGRTWITRLGVLPVERRHGVGRALVDALLAASDQLKPEHTILEVIKNNTPAYNLFVRCNFYQTRELLILRRPPGPPACLPRGQARALHRDESLARLEARPGSPSWVMETASMAHADNLMGLEIALPDGSRGWLVYQELRLRQLPLGISRLALRAEHGEAVRVAEALLAHLYHQYPDLDTHTENIPADDPHLPAFFAMGYVESFRRIEMHRPGPRSLT